jgi:hypothetical protein
MVSRLWLFTITHNKTFPAASTEINGFIVDVLVFTMRACKRFSLLPWLCGIQGSRNRR